MGRLHGLGPSARLAVGGKTVGVTRVGDVCACASGLELELRGGVRARRIPAAPTVRIGGDPGLVRALSEDTGGPVEWAPDARSPHWHLDRDGGQVRAAPEGGARLPEVKTSTRADLSAVLAERALAHRRAQRLLLLEGDSWLDVRVAESEGAGRVEVPYAPFELEVRARGGRAQVVLIEVSEEDELRILRPRAGRTSFEVPGDRWVRVRGRFRLPRGERARLRAVAVRGDEVLDLRPLVEPGRSGASSPLLDLLSGRPVTRTGRVEEEPQWAAATLVLLPEAEEEPHASR